MKYANYYVDYMVYDSLLGKSLFVAFGKSYLGFRKISTPVQNTSLCFYFRIKLCPQYFWTWGPFFWGTISNLVRIYSPLLNFIFLQPRYDTEASIWKAQSLKNPDFIATSAAPYKTMLTGTHMWTVHNDSGFCSLEKEYSKYAFNICLQSWYQHRGARGTRSPLAMLHRL